MAMNDGAKPAFDRAGYEKAFREAMEQQQAIAADPNIKAVNEWLLKNEGGSHAPPLDGMEEWVVSMMARLAPEMGGE
jgi:hypothetical protein